MNSSMPNNYNNNQIKEFSVGEISNLIKGSLERDFGYVKIKGEISGLTIASSGHGYFNLKENNAIISVTCWKHNINKLKHKPQEGLEVVATGKITTYAGQSKYQLSAEYIEPAGIGTLMKILTERKKKLQAEGLFNQENKKSIPFISDNIGIVTSPTGAVIRDMIHRIRARYPTKITVWPVSVQGEKAENEICAAIRGFNEMPNKPNLIIVARGGGSIEDLWAFNEESVVRSIAESNIPVISAIGHETDYTLADFASDMRAPTPTAAAEFATPVLNDLRNSLGFFYNKLLQNISSILSHKLEIIGAFERILRNPMTMVLMREQYLDKTIFALTNTMNKTIGELDNKIKYCRLEHNLYSKIIGFHLAKIESNYGFLTQSTIRVCRNKHENFIAMSNHLNSLDYKKVLHRGYAIVRNNGKLTSSVNQITKDDILEIQLQDGSTKVQKI